MFSASWPIGLLCTSILRDLATPPRHSLFVNAVAWLSVAAFYWYQTRQTQSSRNAKRWKLSCFAGSLYALAQLCDRAPADNNRIWWTKAFLPLFTYSLIHLAIDHDFPKSSAHPNGSHSADRNDGTITRKILFLAFGIGVFALSDIYLSTTTMTLSLCSNLLTAASLWLLQHTLRNHKDEKEVLNSTEGLMQRRRSVSISIRHVENTRFTLRDVSLTIGVICLITSFLFESFRNDGLTYRRRPGLYEHWGTQWQSWQPSWRKERDVIAIVFEGARAVLLLGLAQQEEVLSVSFLSLGSAIIAKALELRTGLSIWLALLFSAILSFVLDDSYPVPGMANTRSRLRARQFVATSTTITLLILSLSSIFGRQGHPSDYDIQQSIKFDQPGQASGPVRLADMTDHPIEVLTRKAAIEFDNMSNAQSTSIQEAAAEYWRRYGVAPPPNFDIWYEFARNRNVGLIDEFDTIHHQLLPFWALEPGMIRSRTTEALGFPGNMLMAIFIREGAIVKLEGGQEWQQKATMGLMKDFVQHLPDMDLAFNVHDEPRVIVPHDLLANMVRTARTESMPAAAQQTKRTNMFSPRPEDMHNGKRVIEVKTTRFNVFAHQPTWTHSKISCPPDSPARYFADGTRDNATTFALTDLGFIYNQTAFSDICQSPSLRGNYGFFDRPNAYNIIQELFPIFSQSKISSYSDIIYPSPWYWFERVEYDEHKDMAWEEKEEKLFWRGSTTGGFSRNGGWKRQHRQRMVSKLNEPEPVAVLTNKPSLEKAGDDSASSPKEWRTVITNRKAFAPMVDVKFSHVGQCDPGDCDAQREYFELVERVDQQDAWQYRHLLDMDGNAFSGRFYAFLKSNSLVYKMNLFQEWHRDWLKPWYHYIPFSIKGDEWLEALRYFSVEKEGKVLAKRIAARSKAFADSTLRNDDFEVWFFRLLLEYGRLIDDNRENIGFTAP